jgi:endonuclease YncB( thermonuclease family)
MVESPSTGRSLSNLGITVGIVVAVVALAVFFKPAQPATRARQPSAQPEVAAAASSAPTASVQRPVRDQFETFTSPRLVDAAANEADSLRMEVSGVEEVFTLYFVDALETTFNHPDRLREQASIFGGATPEAVVETGREALKEVTRLLRERPYRLFTRWESLAQNGRYLALVQVQQENGKWAWLSETLVRQGYALVDGVTTPLPDDPAPMQHHLATLREGAKYAKERRLGIWSRSPAR